MEYKTAYKAWLTDEAIDEATKFELRSLVDDKEIEDRFYRELEFGTAGLRAVIGAGTNRMNKYIVGRATQGYAQYLLSQEDVKRGVAIAYDSRSMSDQFALEASKVLCANGITVYLFDGMRAVPQLSFTILHLNCIGGIVITASHNPKEYNGYKVYGGNGAQIGPAIADAVTKAIQAVDSFGDIKRMDAEQAEKVGLLHMIGEEVDEAYFRYTESLSVDKTVLRAAKQLKLVYTPLFGTGNGPACRILRDLGIENLFVVPEQQHPDPQFPGISAPNPEAQDAYALAIKLADEKAADLIMATDPDGDRLGVGVRKMDGSFLLLSGNQIGCLILHYVLDTHKRMGTLPENALVVKSIVSTNMANKIAESFGVKMAEVLTGFRYIGEKIAESEQTGQYFLFGFEESYGFLSGTKVRDKDAICAALLVTEAAAYYSLRNMTLLDGLDELYAIYGYYRENVKSYTLYGKEGLQKIADAMAGLRKTPPREFAGCKVTAVRDYLLSVRTDNETSQPIDLPKSNVLYFELEDGSWICARPSGTEPKLKVYANGADSSAHLAQQKLDAMLAALEKLLMRYLK